MTFFLKGGKRHWLKNDNKMEKAASLQMSCDKRISESVVLGLQNLPCHTQRNPIQEETKKPFLFMILGV